MSGDDTKPDRPRRPLVYRCAGSSCSYVLLRVECVEDIAGDPCCPKCGREVFPALDKGWSVAIAHAISDPRWRVRSI